MKFIEFPKISRLSREIIITEKIDGTNAQITIKQTAELEQGDLESTPHFTVSSQGIDYTVFVGSRNKWISPTDDNAGFANWVKDRLESLVTLGPGSHFGEWWGSGIQRGYGLSKGEKRFSLFNVGRWTEDPSPKDLKQLTVPSCCKVVPILYRGPFDTVEIFKTLENLKTQGSCAAPGFMKPEGIVIFHTAGGHLYKKTIDKDEQPKSLA